MLCSSNDTFRIMFINHFWHNGQRVRYIHLCSYALLFCIGFQLNDHMTLFNLIKDEVQFFSRKIGLQFFLSHTLLKGRVVLYILNKLLCELLQILEALKSEAMKFFSSTGSKYWVHGSTYIWRDRIWEKLTSSNFLEKWDLSFSRMP